MFHNRRFYQLMGIAAVMASVACEAEVSTSSGAVKRSRSPRPTTDTADSTAMAATMLIRSFPIQTRENLTLTYEPDTGLITHDLTMQHRSEKMSRTYTQTTRPTRNKSFRQGATGTARFETFKQTSYGILDIALVIDNSGSMDVEQKNLAKKLEPLLTSIKDADWRINVTTTDPNNGCSRALIRKGDANAATAFANAVNAGINGSGNEQGIRMAVEGLKCAQSPWVRPNSSIAVLIVSDEDNCSNGNGCGSNAWKNENYLLDYLSKPVSQGGLGRVLGSSARVYGIYWHPKTSCSSGYYEGHQYAAAVQKSGGTWGSICDSDYTATLQKISQDMALILKADFPLIASPDAGSVVVKVNGSTWTSGFSVESSTLRFSQMPSTDATIEVSYTTGASPILKRFSVADRLDGDNQPVPDSLVVSVNGKPLGAKDYSFDAGTREIVFAQTPPENATIDVSFTEGVPLPRRYDLGVSDPVKNVLVSVNGQVTSNLPVIDNQVELAEAPADGASIELSFEVLKEPELTYGLPGNVFVETAEFYDKESGATVKATISGDRIEFEAEEFADGRVVVLQHRREQYAPLAIELPAPPIEGSLVVETHRPDCALGQGIVRISDTAYEAQCPWEPGDLITVNLSFHKPAPLAFTLDEVEQPDVGVWEVTVNDRAANFSRQNKTVHLLEAPPEGAVVTVVYRPQGI